MDGAFGGRGEEADKQSVDENGCFFRFFGIFGRFCLFKASFWERLSGVYGGGGFPVVNSSGMME
jgi:hypothetical protein